MNINFWSLIFCLFVVKFCKSQKYCDTYGLHYEELEVNSITNQINFLCNRRQGDVKWLAAYKFNCKQFPDEVFDRFSKLYKIEFLIESKKIDEINPNFFIQKSYKNVTQLILQSADGNPLNQIEIAKFVLIKKFPNLKEFSVTNFNFTSFEEIELGQNLRALKLFNNNIKKLHNNQLKNLENLELLYLNQNQLENLSEKYLSNNSRLRKLFFSANKIIEIPQNFFSGLFDLEEVDFQSNQLNYLPSMLFQDNKQLNKINFRWNQIQKLHPQIFVGPTNLRWKYFYDNPCVTSGDKSDNLENCFKNWE